MLALWLSLAFVVAPQSGASPAALTPDEALALAFPGCVIERGTQYLDKREEERVETLAGVELETRVVRPYVAKKDGKLVGTAYFDAHRVRTKNEVLMLVVAPDERLKRIEVLSFAEPPEYLPKPAFYAQFAGKKLSDELAVGRDVRGVAGATLSANATAGAVRRVLALHRVLAERTPALTAAR
jgi:uncharacterized protein with FMN-binding domain